MGLARITNAGIAQMGIKQQAQEPLIIDRFMLAYIDGLDTSLPADRDEPLPALADQVRVLAVSNSGYLNPHSVVYSLYLGTGEGTYTFNWLGLLDEDDNLIAVRYIDPVTKRATAGGVLGDALTRNFIINYNDAASITNITVEASTWQFHHDDATELQRGIIRISNNQEANELTDNTTAMSPQKVGDVLIPIVQNFDAEIQNVMDTIPYFSSSAPVQIVQSNNHVHLNVYISDSVTSTASGTAASSQAVKTAYDAAQSKVADVRLGTEYRRLTVSDGVRRAESGGVMTGIEMEDWIDRTKAVFFRPVQVQYGSVWYTI